MNILDGLTNLSILTRVKIENGTYPLFIIDKEHPKYNSETVATEYTLATYAVLAYCSEKSKKYILLDSTGKEVDKTSSFISDFLLIPINVTIKSPQLSYEFKRNCIMYLLVLATTITMSIYAFVFSIVYYSEDSKGLYAYIGTGPSEEVNDTIYRLNRLIDYLKREFK
ncbi:hypothetical protein KDD93_08600 [Campylobacter sp. faydin G-24]|uniref:Uncharacterized protein n=1 Tax=Campylobacter anatolicus TaxID=2829105 RepID=A0ABS5HK49_9BACT|nr:hypothetical protein [Campylobacter anatolicus]MBR8464616.1 hypothetical protein [Campylobacter anatolicus]